MQEARPLIKRVRERQLRKRLKREKRKVYELEYDNGGCTTLLQLLPHYLATYGVELIAHPVYCGVCKMATIQAYYRLDDTVRCIVCDNHLGANDPRPLAPVLPSGY